ncbi:23S rRNA (guanosine-2'-O-)-methyltransferase RlmB [Anatilimnocola aggregata]|uniref:23S rRNA (Guanosine-2'-O-)-methyltransferase RlmB n=1 Tax=Anatilimnocola aggregata TaxID=2528021 RepID=A0A517Y6W1_9BACT|nr:RNA methyltransferase [Anatilimnocola aggregata]QDU25960.1 23S rRNA (guanosine-2'-O-)-methyltransferase RlmB [Anatilimnocola aggregata]
MPLIPITNTDDSRVAPYRQLHQTNLTRGSKLFVAEGDKVVQRLLDSSFVTDSVLAEADWAERLAPQLPPETPIYVAPRELMTELVGFRFHRGVLACGQRKPAPDLRAMMPPLDQPATILVCPAVQDPTNLGSIVRTAAALGVAAILLGSDCADPFSRRVLRVSMGSVLFIPVREAVDLVADVVALREEHGFEVLATVLDNRAVPLSQVPKPKRLALVLGSEGHGLDERWLKLCPQQITLPMQAGIDSLNVAVAAAVFLYHFQQAALTDSVDTN